MKLDFLECQHPILNGECWIIASGNPLLNSYGYKSLFNTHRAYVKALKPVVIF